ncbi:TolC family protein [Comamonas odontotermitis]|uniref:TolC family protein n=1 Tax=Comamonas odontotermitis TaxID=379895 RepID=UPI003750EFA0
MQEISHIALRRVFIVKFKLSSALLGIGIASLMAGCASPPQPELDHSTPASWLQAPPARPDAQAVTVAELQHWWLRLADPALNALVDEALTHNMTLGETLDQLKAQRILLSVASTAYQPQFTAGIRTLQDIAAVDSYFHASIDMSWDLGLFGAMESSKLAAYGELMGVQAQLHQVRVELIANVVQRYLDIRVAQRQRALLEERIALDERLLTLSDVRLQQRIGSSDALHQAQLELTQARAQRATLKESQVRAAHALAALLGRQAPDSHWLDPDATANLPDTRTLRLQVLPAEMLRMRAPVQLAQARVEQAAAKLGLSRSALYPRFALGGSLLYSYNITQNLRTRSDQMPMVGPVIDIPLFDWGRRRAQVSADEAAMDGAIKAYRQSVLDGLAEVEAALGGFNAQTERLQSQGTVQNLLAARNQVLQRRKELGLASEYNLITERRAVLQNASEQGISLGAQALAYVSLFKALGGAPLPAQAGETASATMPATVAPAPTQGQTP